MSSLAPSAPSAVVRPHRLSPVRARAIAVALVLTLAAGGVGACAGGSSAGSVAARAASSQVGNRYVYGGASPSSGFDCSGLTSWAWSQAGRTIPRTSTAQYSGTQRISRADLRPGDLVFYGTSGVSHVAMYVGGGRIVQARKTGVPVEAASLDTYWVSALIGYGRIR